MHHDLMNRAARVAGVAVLCCAAFAGSATVVAENPCVQANPTSAASVTGEAWLGRADSVVSQPFEGRHMVTLVFDVSDVLAGTDLSKGQTLTMESGPCGV